MKHLGLQCFIKIKYDCHLFYFILNHLIRVEQQVALLYILSAEHATHTNRQRYSVSFVSLKLTPRSKIAVVFSQSSTYRKGSLTFRIINFPWQRMTSCAILKYIYTIRNAASFVHGYLFGKKREGNQFDR